MRQINHDKRSRQRGFTLIELLLVIAIIALLVGLLLVGLNKVRAKAEFASTEQLMTSIDMGLNSFKTDHGFFPPLFDDRISAPHNGELIPYPNDDAEDLDYYSTLSLAPYLLGMGDLNGDGQLDQYDDGEAGLGMRNPTADQSWGFAYRSPNGNGRKAYWKSKEQRVNGKPMITGQIFGPYVEIDAEQQVEYATNRAGVEFKEPPLYAIHDYWGRPIRYYRFWPTTFSPGESLEQEVPEWFASLKKDEVESFRVKTRSAGFILMSEGPDREADSADLDAGDNEDNMVRVQS